ncbi:MAG: Na+/H+ antiporter subunit E [Candidatus Omnitrophica bacterium]|nr:Na+/H+ antiporter subunit E [Candidatus Omnitrophota bacterium]
MKIKIIIFILAFFTWLLLSWSVDPEHLIIGVLVGILICLVTSDIFLNPPRIFKNPSRYLWFIYYLLLFTWECIKANLDGAYRVAHPDLPIHPGIVKVKTTLKSDVGLTFLANSLTLKPGTMTVDIDKEKGFLYVHWADVKSQDIEKATDLIVRKFERVLMRIFS